MTLDNDAIFVRMKEILVKKMLPNGMNQFPAAVCNYVPFLSLPLLMHGLRPILK